MLSMFELTTGDNWPDTMHSAMNAVAIDSQPVINHSSQNGLYFVAFICIAFFLMVKVFVGVFMKEVRSIAGAYIVDFSSDRVTEAGPHSRRFRKRYAACTGQGHA